MFPSGLKLEIHFSITFQWTSCFLTNSTPWCKRISWIGKHLGSQAVFFKDSYIIIFTIIYIASEIGSNAKTIPFISAEEVNLCTHVQSLTSLVTWKEDSLYMWELRMQWCFYAHTNVLVADVGLFFNPKLHGLVLFLLVCFLICNLMVWIGWYTGVAY